MLFEGLVLRICTFGLITSENASLGLATSENVFWAYHLDNALRACPRKMLLTWSSDVKGSSELRLVTRKILF